MSKELPSDYPVFEQKGQDEYACEVVYDVLNRNDRIIDRAGREYVYGGKYLQDSDFYQGLNMIAVIRSVDTGRLYGYSYWDGQGHYEDNLEPNGEEFGLECDYSADDFDWENDYVSYYVWQPVKEKYIKGYDYE